MIWLFCSRSFQIFNGTHSVFLLEPSNNMTSHHKQNIRPGTPSFIILLSYELFSYVARLPTAFIDQSLQLYVSSRGECWENFIYKSPIKESLVINLTYKYKDNFVTNC